MDGKVWQMIIKSRNMKGESYPQAIANNLKLLKQKAISKDEFKNLNKQALKIN